MILVRSMKCCFISFCKWVMKRSELEYHHHLNGLLTDVEHNWARVGWGNFCHFCQYFAHCFDQVLKGIVFFFLFQIEEEVPSTELSCYGFKTQGMNFYVPSDFWFSLIAKNMSSCC